MENTNQSQPPSPSDNTSSQTNNTLPQRSKLRANVPTFRPRFIRVVQLPKAENTTGKSLTSTKNSDDDDELVKKTVKLSLSSGTTSSSAPSALFNHSADVNPSSSVPVSSSIVPSSTATTTTTTSRTVAEKRYGESFVSRGRPPHTTVSRTRELVRILKSAKSSSPSNAITSASKTAASEEDESLSVSSSSSQPYYIYPHTVDTRIAETPSSSTPPSSNAPSSVASSSSLVNSSLDTLIHIPNRWNILHQLAISDNEKNIQQLDTLYRTYSPWEWSNALNAKDKYGDRPIHIAARNGCAAIIEIFLRELPKKYSIDINMRTITPLALAPLHLACLGGHVNVVNLLLRNGMDIQAKDKYKRNALYYAIVHAAVFRSCPYPVDSTSGLLSMTTVQPSVHDDYSSQYSNALAIIDILLNANVDLNNVDSDGYTPLFYACTAQVLECIESFVLRGAGIISAILEYPITSSSSSVNVTKGTSASTSASSSLLITDVQNILRHIDQANRLQITKGQTMHTDTPRKHDKGNKGTVLTSSPSFPIVASGTFSSPNTPPGTVLSLLHSLAESGNSLAIKYIFQALRTLNGQENVDHSNHQNEEEFLSLSTVDDYVRTNDNLAALLIQGVTSGSTLPSDLSVQTLLLSRETTFPHDTPLHTAVRSCSPMTVAYLLNLSRTHNCLSTVLSTPNKEGYTPLHLCVSRQWEREESEELFAEENLVRQHSSMDPVHRRDEPEIRTVSTNDPLRSFSQFINHQSSPWLAIRRSMWDVWEFAMLEYDHAVYSHNSFHRSGSFLWYLSHENDLKNTYRHQQQYRILSLLIQYSESLPGSSKDQIISLSSKVNKSDSLYRLSPLAVALQSSNTEMAVKLLSVGAILDSTAISMFALPYFSIVRRIHDSPDTSFPFHTVLNNKHQRVYLERVSMGRYPWWNIDTGNSNVVWSRDSYTDTLSRLWVHYHEKEDIDEPIRLKLFYLLRPIVIGLATITDPDGILSEETSYRIERLIGFANEQIALRSLGNYVPDRNYELTQLLINMNEVAVQESVREWGNTEYTATYKHHPSLWSFQYNVEHLNNLNSYDILLEPIKSEQSVSLTEPNMLTTDGWMNISQEINDFVSISVVAGSDTTELPVTEDNDKVPFTVEPSWSETSTLPHSHVYPFTETVKVFPCHRSMLSLRSYYLRILLNHHLTPSSLSTAPSVTIKSSTELPLLSVTVPISVSSSVSLLIILRWIYTDQFSETTLLQYEGMYTQELWDQLQKEYEFSGNNSSVSTDNETLRIDYIQLPLPPYILLLTDVSILAHMWNMGTLHSYIDDVWCTVLQTILKTMMNIPSCVLEDYVYHIYLILIGIQSVTNHTIGTAAMELLIDQPKGLFLRLQQKQKEQYASEQCYFRISRKRVAPTNVSSLVPHHVSLSEADTVESTNSHSANYIPNTPTSVIPVVYRYLYENNLHTSHTVNHGKKEIGPSSSLVHFPRAIHGLYGYPLPEDSFQVSDGSSLTSSATLRTSYLYSTIRLYLASSFTDIGYDVPNETMLHCSISVLRNSVLYLLDHVDVCIPLCNKIWKLSLLEKSGILTSSNVDLLPYDLRLFVDIPSLFSHRLPEFIYRRKTCTYCTQRRKRQYLSSSLSVQAIDEEGCMPEEVLRDHSLTLLLWYFIFPGSIARDTNPNRFTSVVALPTEGRTKNYSVSMKRIIDNSQAIGAYSDMEWLSAFYRQQFTDTLVNFTIEFVHPSNPRSLTYMTLSVPAHSAIIHARIPALFSSVVSSGLSLRMIAPCVANRETAEEYENVWKQVFLRCLRWSYGDLWVHTDTLPLPSDNLIEILRRDEASYGIDYALHISKHVKVSYSLPPFTQGSIESTVSSARVSVVPICVSCLSRTLPYSVVSQVLLLYLLQEIRVLCPRLLGSIEAWLMRWIRNCVDHCSLLYDNNMDKGGGVSIGSSSNSIALLPISSQQHSTSIELTIRTISSLSILLSLWRNYLSHYSYSVNLWRIESYLSLALLRTISILTKNMDSLNNPEITKTISRYYFLPKESVPCSSLINEERVSSTIGGTGTTTSSTTRVSNHSVLSISSSITVPPCSGDNITTDTVPVNERTDDGNINECPCVSRYTAFQMVSSIPSLVIWVLRQEKF